MRRRHVIALTAGAVAWPVLARAQKPVPIVAILGSGSATAASSVAQMKALREGMRAVGLVEGRDYVFEDWWAGSAANRFPVLAGEILARRPAAIVVSTLPAAQAVQERTRTVPIVMTGINDPVAAGLVASLAHPGGNVTGVTNMAEDVLLKLMEMLREVMPNARTVAVMTNPSNPQDRAMVGALSRYAATAGLSIGTVHVSLPGDLDAAFEEMVRQKPAALLVLSDNSLSGLSEQIIERATLQRIPVFGNDVGLEFVQAGGLLAYARDYNDSFKGVAVFLKKILAGANPGDLPIEQPTQFRLLLNLKTAKELGISMPVNLVALADDVVE